MTTTQKAAHTPGPFSFDGHGINDKDGRRVAKVSLSRDTEEFDRLSVLIASAHELLAALETMLAIREKQFTDAANAAFVAGQVALPWPDIQAAQAAIRKAKGEAQ